jgi:hypothetical protein
LDERNFEEDKTVHWKITALGGGKKVELRETPRAVTPFGGLVVFFEFPNEGGKGATAFPASSRPARQVNRSGRLGLVQRLYLND